MLPSAAAPRGPRGAGAGPGALPAGTSDVETPPELTPWANVVPAQGLEMDAAGPYIVLDAAQRAIRICLPMSDTWRSWPADLRQAFQGYVYRCVAR
jgi:hypothetical protein